MTDKLSFALVSSAAARAAMKLMLGKSRLSSRCGKACAAVALATLAACSSAGRLPGGLTWDTAVFSSSRALEVVFNEVCLPAILDGGSIGQRASDRALQQVPASSIGAVGATDRDFAWRLPMMAGGAYVVAWEDGSCTASVDSGSSDELRAVVIAAINARPEGFTLGSSESIESGRRVRAAYCTRSVAPPFVVGVTTQTRWGRPALVATVFRAHDPAPPFCAPAADPTGT